MSARTLLAIIGLGGILLSGPGACTAHAQGIELEWEQVGQPIEPDDLAFSIDGTLWSVGEEVWKLLPGETKWNSVSDQFLNFVLPLQPDTLVGSILASGVGLSLDGGKTWPAVFDEGGKLFASDLAGPSGGALLTGIFDSTGVGYSHDRGATWNRADGLETSSLFHVCEAFHEISSGPFTGRLLAGCIAGMAYSDDRGVNWSLSNLWVDFTYAGRSIITTQNNRLFAHIGDPEPGFGLWASDDDGVTWIRRGEVPSQAILIGVPGGPAPEGVFYAVGLGGDFHRSLDAGQTWQDMGQIYNGPESFRISAAILGPDDRIYVASTGSGPGPQPHWGVYRTTEPVIVANEPEAPQPSEATLRVYPNPATDRITVEVNRLDEDVVLYDLLGRAVRRARLVSGSASVDVSSLAAGLYILRVDGLTRLVTVAR